MIGFGNYDVDALSQFANPEVAESRELEMNGIIPLDCHQSGRRILYGVFSPNACRPLEPLRRNG